MKFWKPKNVLTNIKIFFQRFLKISIWRKIALLITICAIGYIVFTIFKSDNAGQHFTWLANAFSEGQLNFRESDLPSYKWDFVQYMGDYFWPSGPFPAIILVPFVFLGKLFGYTVEQEFLQMILFFGIFWLVYMCSRKIGYKSFDSWLFASVFVAGSALLRLLTFPESYYYAHIVTVFLIFSALYEYLHKRRLYLIGILMGFTLMSRFTAGLGLIFFIIEILRENEPVKKKVAEIFTVTLPVVGGYILLGLYNLGRFGNFFEQGYNFQNLFHSGLATARDIGLFNIVHLPTNLFYAFLQGPVPIFRDHLQVLQFPYISADLWGMGIFFTSPYLLTLFFLNYSKKIQISLLVTSIIVSIPIFLFYATGFVQVGYRYSFDFLPYLFVLFMIGYKEMHVALSKRMIFMFICAIIFNIYIVHYFVIK